MKEEKKKRYGYVPLVKTDAGKRKEDSTPGSVVVACYCDCNNCDCYVTR